MNNPNTPEHFAHGPKGFRQTGPLVLSLLTILAILCFVMGLAFQCKAGNTPAACTAVTPPETPGLLQKAFNAPYDLMRLMTFQKNMHVDFPESRIACWLALIGGIFMAVTVGIIGLTVLFRLWQRYRLLKMEGHIVICGLGAYLGIPIAKKYLTAPAIKDRRKVVAIELDPENPQSAHAINQLRDLGAIVLKGNALDDDLLKTARISSAERMFAVTDNDMANMEIALAADSIVSNETKKRSLLIPPTLFAHVKDTGQAETLMAESALASQGHNKINVFNLDKYLSHQLIHKLYSASKDIEEIRTHQKAVHVVLIGFGELGQTNARELAGQLHFPNRKRLRLSICDSDIDSKSHAFLQRYPSFCPEPGKVSLNKTAWSANDKRDHWDYHDSILRPLPHAQGELYCGLPQIEYACNAEFIDIPSAIDSPLFIDTLLGSLNPSEVVTHIIVCHDDVHRNINAALCLRVRLEEQKWPASALPSIIVMLPGATPAAVDLCTIKRKTNREAPISLSPINDAMTWFADQKTPFSISPEDIDIWAKKIHDNYEHHEVEKAKTQGTNYIVTAWENLTETMRQSNRQRALFMEHGLLMLGIQIEKADECKKEPININDVDITMLAEIEHNRWLSERLLAGWRYAIKTDKPARRHKLLIPFAGLSADDKAKDESLLTEIFDYLAKTSRVPTRN